MASNNMEPRTKHDASEGSPGCKSWVASRFNLIDDDGVQKRQCRYANCTKEYSRGTSHMILKRHWSKQHGTNDEDLPCAILRSQTNNDISDQLASDEQHQIKFKAKKVPLKASNVSASKNKSIVQNTGYTFDNKGNVDKTQLDAKLVVKRLREAASVHITFDIYTAKKNAKTYGSITAHSIGDPLEVKSVLLEYKHLPYPDDSSAVFEFFKSCITKFNIKEKIISITTNCSKTVVSAIHEVDRRCRLSKNYNYSTAHLRCFPHFVHKNIMDVFKSQDDLVESIRKVVIYINNNTVCLRPMIQDDLQVPQGTGENKTDSMDNNGILVLDQGTKGLKLPYDQKSSWDTTYNMIESFSRQRELIEPTLLYFQNPQELANVHIDWDRLFILIRLLKPFYEAINYFVRENFMSAALVAAMLPQLMNHLSSSSWAYDDLVMAAHNFRSQLENYQQFFCCNLTTMAALLDPRVKDSFLPLEARESAINSLRSRIDSLPNSKPRADLYPEGHLCHNMFAQFYGDEVSHYFKEPREVAETNVIGYWEAKKSVYPGLHGMAKMLCCIQANSVPIGRMFSAADHCEIPREKKFHVDSTNSKEVIKSWAKYLDR